MIRYSLRCAKGHVFESWFQSSSAYESQRRRKLVTCPVCDSAAIEKTVMAPALKGAKKGRGTDPAPEAGASAAPLAVVSAEERELRAKLKELRDHLTKNAAYVGQEFPEEARKMHYGETDQRSIYGEASLDDAKKLLDEGIEFHPIPSLPDERN